MSAALPAKPSLEQLKKQAKDLLAAHAGKSPECLPALRHLNRFTNAEDTAIYAASLKLADVQFALAIEYGFKTWDELSRHVESRNSGLSEKAASAWARLRQNGDLAKLIGGAPKSVADASWGWLTNLEVEGSHGRFTVEVAEPGDSTARLIRKQRMGEYLHTIGIAAPRITILEAEGQTFGVNPKFEGIPCDSVPLSDADRDVIMNQVAGLLDRMHAVPLPDALRILGLPAMSAEEAARKYRFGFDYLDLKAFESAWADELKADKALNELWRETREWLTTYVSTPADMVFGHGDLWLGSVLLAKTPEGYRLSGVHGLWNAGLMNRYDEFLRVAGLSLFEEQGEPEGRRIIEAYNAMPGRSRRVEMIPLRHAIRTFWFYLAAAPDNTAEKRANYLASAKRSQRMW